MRQAIAAEHIEGGRIGMLAIPAQGGRGASMAKTRPVVALAMGDPAGISPELTAKVLALEEVRQVADLVVIGDRRVFEEGARIAKTALDLDTVDVDARLPQAAARPLFVDLGHLDPASIRSGEVARA